MTIWVTEKCLLPVLTGARVKRANVRENIPYLFDSTALPWPGAYLFWARQGGRLFAERSGGGGGGGLIISPNIFSKRGHI